MFKQLRYRNHERYGPTNGSKQNISRAMNFKKTKQRLGKIKSDASHAGKHRVNKAFSVFSETRIYELFMNDPKVGMNIPSHALSGYVTNVSKQTANVEKSHRYQRTGLRTSEDEHRHIRNMANVTNLTKPGIHATNVKPETKHSCYK